MDARTYRGGTMREALARVRRDLGGDAVILAAREIRRRRLFGLGLGSRPMIEVEASSAMPSDSEPTAAAASASATFSSKPPAALGAELGRLHATVERLSRGGRFDHWLIDLPGELAPIYGRLLEAEAPEPLARALVRLAAELSTPEELETAGDAARAVRRTLADSLAVAPPVGPLAGTRRVAALIGPTGVGKTTTIAKLAANLKLQSGVRVGLLTIDTYRIAAVEQLKTYADIIDVPLVVGADAPSALRAIDELGSVDLILVDTAGRSPRDEAGLRELTELLAELGPDEVHLVLSAAASARNLRAAVDRFAPARPDRLILTKLDEAETFGPLLAVVGRTDRPVAHLTTGQSVPDAIEAASAHRLAGLILGEETVA